MAENAGEGRPAARSVAERRMAFERKASAGGRPRRPSSDPLHGLPPRPVQRASPPAGEARRAEIGSPRFAALLGRSQSYSWDAEQSRRTREELARGMWASENDGSTAAASERGSGDSSCSGDRRSGDSLGETGSGGLPLQRSHSVADRVAMFDRSSVFEGAVRDKGPSSTGRPPRSPSSGSPRGSGDSTQRGSGSSVSTVPSGDFDAQTLRQTTPADVSGLSVQEINGRYRAMTMRRFDSARLQQAIADETAVGSSGSPVSSNTAAGSDRGGVSTGEDGRVRAGSREALIEYLTSPSKIDTEFMHVFFMTYHSFMDGPGALLRELLQRYSDIKSTEKALVKQIQIRVYVVLQKWMEMFPDDVRKLSAEDELKLNSFARDTLTTDGHGPAAQQLQSLLGRKHQPRTGRMLVCGAELPPPPPPRAPPAAMLERVRDNQPSSWCISGNVDPLEIARQLTMTVFDLFHSIQPPELLNQNWNKHKDKAPSVLKLVANFNNLASWTASCVVAPSSVSERANVFERFVSIAEELYKLNNFDSLMAILAGLSNASVHRLHHTKEHAPKRAVKRLERLSEIMSSAQSFKVYRETLSSCGLPCIPYLGVFLQDLTFLEDGNNDLTGDGKINFHKRFKVCDVIQRVLKYQNMPYNLERVPVLESILQQFTPNFSEDDLYTLSLKREPRGASWGDIAAGTPAIDASTKVTMSLRLSDFIVLH